MTTESGTTEARDTVPAEPPRRFPVVAVALLGLGIAGLLYSVVLEGQRPRPAGQGHAAPDFRLEKFGGGEVRLADLRGKTVMLDFWATWCGPCIAEFPSLKSVTDRFGKDDRVVFLSLSLDKDLKTVSEFLDKRKDHPDTIQAFLGPWSDDSVTKDYGVEAIPAIFLVGPDGKILARDLRGDDVGARLTGVLGEPKRR